MRNHLKTLALVAAATMAFVGTYAQAAVIGTIYGDTENGELDESGSINTTVNGANRFQSGTRVDLQEGMVAVFDVSVLNSLASGETVDTASVSAYLESVLRAHQIPDTASADWYFAGFSSTADLSDDQPTELDYTTPGALLADNIANENSTTGIYYSTTAASGSTLAGILNGRATDGSDDFLYILLKLDESSEFGTSTDNTVNGLLWTSAKPATNKPKLDITTMIDEEPPVAVPTPAALPAGLGLMMLGLMMRKRSRLA